MKIPVRPPPIDELINVVVRTDLEPNAFQLVFQGGHGPAPHGKYHHWDRFRHIETPAGLTPEQYWLAVKLARRQLYRPFSLRDGEGDPFQFALPPLALEMLHYVDRHASGIIGAPAQVTNPATQATYLLKSIAEESIRSSQLEGASTTRRVAKDMILEGRTPRTRSERMIMNNFAAMQRVRQVRNEPLTPDLVLAIQATLTNGTLDVPDGAGRLRRADEDIHVEDETGTTLHIPPRAEELPARMKALCRFANGEDTREFIHPVVRAILVHFWLAYDHPFVDGNGRTARALFYWSMAHEGYWLAEYVSISRILKRARAQYARSFLYTETDENDATYFLLYQLQVLKRAIRDLHAYLDRKASEIHDAELLMRRSSTLRGMLNHRQLDLLTHALKNPYTTYTIESHRRAHQVAYGTARNDLLDLARHRLLRKAKRGRAFAFVAPDDLRVRLSGATR
jgi:Fic family protein